MDAHALLTSQGWRGTGHSLHSNNDSIGLARPLLVSQKQNTLGIGKKQHSTSDMWWMNAYDETLKGLKTTETKDGNVTLVQTVTSGKLDMVAKGGSKYVGGKGGLYACFVKGEGLVGSMGMMEEQEKEVGDVVVEKSKKRKRGGEVETKEERRARKAAKRAAKAADIESDTQLQTSTLASDEAADEPLPSGETEAETKEQRRERRRLKKLQKQEKIAKEAMKAESKKDADSKDSSEKKKKKKGRKDDKV